MHNSANTLPEQIRSRSVVLPPPSDPRRSPSHLFPNTALATVMACLNDFAKSG